MYAARPVHMEFYFVIYVQWVIKKDEFYVIRV